jgi:hypothetical protein
LIENHQAGTDFPFRLFIFRNESSPKLRGGKQPQGYGVFLKSNYGGKWKLSGSRGGFDAGARRTAPEGGRGPQAF